VIAERFIAVGGITALLLGCGATRIGNPSQDYEPVELNRVYPHPSDRELHGQKTEVVLASRYARDLPEEEVGRALTTLQRSLEHTLGEAGVGVIDRGIHDLAAVREELEAAESARGSNEFTGADWALVSRITRFRQWAVYEPPRGLFKSEEELAGEPGTCKHHGTIEAEVKVFAIPTDDVARTTFTLRSSGELSTKEHDTICPISQIRREVFLEEILEDALPCLELPLKRRFPPRGYIEEHRVSPGEDAHIFRTSLGERNGARPGLELDILRVQYMTAADGRRLRDERRIGGGRISDEIGDGYSWITLDAGSLEQPILAGDLVRVVYENSLTTRFELRRCKEILTVEGQK
jgi:hypothetical protein